MIQIARLNPERVQTVAELSQLLERCPTAILTDYRGLSVSDITELRKKLREVGAEVHVVKNTLFRLAAKGTPAEGLSSYLEGPTAATFTAGDSAAAAKALTEFAKEHKEVVMKAGVVDGVVYAGPQIAALAKLPSREVLLAQIMASINAPASGIVGVTHSVIRKLMGTITAVAEKQNAAAA